VCGNNFSDMQKDEENTEPTMWFWVLRMNIVRMLNFQTRVLEWQQVSVTGNSYKFEQSFEYGVEARRWTDFVLKPPIVVLRCIRCTAPCLLKNEWRKTLQILILVALVVTGGGGHLQVGGTCQAVHHHHIHLEGGVAVLFRRRELPAPGHLPHSNT